MYAQRRFGWTHGEGGGEGSSLVLLTKKYPRGVIACTRGSPKRQNNLTHFQFENRSRTTCSRFLQSFASPDEAVDLQVS